MPRRVLTVSVVALRMGRTSFCSRLMRLASCTMSTINATPMTRDSRATTMMNTSRILSVGAVGCIKKKIATPSRMRINTTPATMLAMSVFWRRSCSRSSAICSGGSCGAEGCCSGCGSAIFLLYREKGDFGIVTRTKEYIYGVRGLI